MILPRSEPAPRRVLIEACVSSFDDAIAAVEAGADRLELCSALEVAGLTPSMGLIERVVDAVEVPVVVMIRPRVGDFTSSESEFATALADIRAAQSAGAAGVVFGFLDSDGAVDGDLTRRVVEAAGDLETVFHRAIDFSSDPLATAELLADLGVTRVLTSGGAPRALNGAECIRQMIQRTQGRLEVLAGGGVRPDNVRQLVDATGCEQVHLGPSIAKCDGGFASRENPCLANIEMLSTNHHRRLDPNGVRQVVQQLSASDCVRLPT